jgi:hypothetical protein
VPLIWTNGAALWLPTDRKKPGTHSVHDRKGVMQMRTYDRPEAKKVSSATILKAAA